MEAKRIKEKKRSARLSKRIPNLRFSFSRWKKRSTTLRFFILLYIYLPRSFIRLLARNTGISAFALYQTQKFTRAISFVSHNYGVSKRKSVEQKRCNLYIVDITGTQEQFNRSAFFINSGMNFRILTAFALSYELLKPFFAPKPCWWILTKVESRLNSSGILSFVNLAKIFSKTPFCCSRQKYL